MNANISNEFNFFDVDFFFVHGAMNNSESVTELTALRKHAHVIYRFFSSCKN